MTPSSWLQMNGMASSSVSLLHELLDVDAGVYPSRPRPGEGTRIRGADHLFRVPDKIYANTIEYPT